MSSEWPIYPLDSLCLKITDGAHQSPKSVIAGKSMASVKDLTRFGVDLSEARKISSEDFDVLVKQGCQPIVGDVLIAKDGNSALDTVCCVDEPLDAVLLSSVAILRPNPKLMDTHYLKHYLSSRDVIEYLKTNFISGAAIPRVVLRDFKKAEVKIPPLNMQIAIAATLNSLDDRIKLLRETNTTLEAIAQAIFKSWFVDFDPVRAKMAGREPEGMSAATAALFPDTLKDSGLGEIPVGWSVGELSNVLSLHKGTVSPGSSPDLEYQHFSLPSFDNGQMPIFEQGKTIKSNKTTVPESAVLLSKLNPHIPRIWLPSSIGQYAVCSTEFLPLVPTESSTTSFIYCLLSASSFTNRLAQLVTGTSNSHQRIKPANVLSMSLAVPPKEVVKEFDAVVGPLLAKLKASREAAHSLAGLRDTLLPRLISGQLRLPETAEMST